MWGTQMRQSVYNNIIFENTIGIDTTSPNIVTTTPNMSAHHYVRHIWSSSVRTGWRRRTGCLIFAGHFRKRALLLVSLLQKKNYNLRHPMHLRHPVVAS